MFTIPPPPLPPPGVTCHMSHIMCHMSSVTCHVSRVMYHAYIYIYLVFIHFSSLDKKVEIVGGGSVINSAYPVQFQTSLLDNKYLNFIKKKNLGQTNSFSGVQHQKIQQCKVKNIAFEYFESNGIDFFFVNPPPLQKTRAETAQTMAYSEI